MEITHTPTEPGLKFPLVSDAGKFCPAFSMLFWNFLRSDDVLLIGSRRQELFVVGWLHEVQHCWIFTYYKESHEIIFSYRRTK